MKKWLIHYSKHGVMEVDDVVYAETSVEACKKFIQRTLGQCFVHHIVLLGGNK